MAGKSYILPQVVRVKVVAQGDVEVRQVDETQSLSPGTQAQSVEGRSPIFLFFPQMEVIEGAEFRGSLFPVEVFARGGAKPGAIKPKPGPTFENTRLKGGADRPAGFLDALEFLGERPRGQLLGIIQVQGKLCSLTRVGGSRGRRKPAGRKVPFCRDHHLKPLGLEVLQR
jgi:hypothetical protein